MITRWFAILQQYDSSVFDDPYITAEIAVQYCTPKVEEEEIIHSM
jgi:hypothetical protein